MTDPDFDDPEYPDYRPHFERYLDMGGAELMLNDPDGEAVAIIGFGFAGTPGLKDEFLMACDDAGFVTAAFRTPRGCECILAAYDDLDADAIAMAKDSFADLE